MIFDRLWVLNLLWVLPFIVFVLIIAGRKRDQGLKGFADSELLDRLCISETKPRRVVRASFLILSMGLMILSLAGPRWGERFQEVTQRGVDIMVCMDVSSSMLVEDIKPNRLESARREVIDLINIIQGDRLGLIAFAGNAFLQCPLTMDYNALLMFLGQVSPDLIPVYGTDLGKAIDTASDSFDEKSLSDKVILLITDGEDNEGEGLIAAKKAGKLGIHIFVFGLGDPSGGPVPQMEEEGFEKDDQGRLVLSKLNEKTLRDIASVSGGVYVRSIQGDLDLDRIYFDGIRKRTEAGILKSGKIKVFEERFYLFLFAAMILLLLEGFLNERLYQSGDA
jgi:Ca-activated chloride channel family protein